MCTIKWRKVGGIYYCSLRNENGTEDLLGCGTKEVIINYLKAHGLEDVDLDLLSSSIDMWCDPTE